MTTQGLLRTYATAASGVWAAALLQFVAGVIVVRSLAPGEAGTFFFGVAIAAFAFGILDLRIEEGLTQFLVRETNAGREFSHRAAVRYAVGIDFLTGGMILLVTLAGASGVAWDSNGQTRLVVAVVALSSFVGAADGSLAAVLYAQHAFGWISAYQVVANGGRCVALLALPINTPGDAAWAVVIAQATATAFLAFVVLRRLPRSTRAERLAAADRSVLLRFSVHVALASAIATIRTTAIPLVLGMVGTRREVASARVAEAPTRLLGVAASPLRTLLFPRLSAAWARRDRSAARRLVRQYLVTTALIGGPLGVAMALVMDTLITSVYGEAYDGIAHVGQIFVVAAVLDAVAGWQKVAPASLDRPWLRTFILTAEATVLVGALVLLVPTWGPTGAATAAVVAAAVSLLVGAYWLAPAFAEEAWVGTERDRSWREAAL